MQVVYVSGRKRPPGEMNGKSGNINNCCSQIYPKGTKIPTNEVVCIFDADQVHRYDECVSPLQQRVVHNQCKPAHPRHTGHDITTAC